MLNDLIANKTRAWLATPGCPARGVMAYIRKKGRMREPQIEAIAIFLYLKLEGRNRPLPELFSEGFFADEIDLARENINQATRNYLRNNTPARALYEFAACKQLDGKPRLPSLKAQIMDNPEALDYERIIRDMFYRVEYADYLMSLPMGAGKTFLMAAFIYLELYFAQNETENPVFAHNFLVLIPSGLKSSIAPSLKTMESFDPEWVIPNPAADQIKGQLSFDILDQQKSAKSSNQIRNPNVLKVSRCFPDPFAHIFVVNAEKVILDRLETTAQGQLIEKSEDERDRAANELRHWIGKLPRLSILIDEVHHAATNEIKLRQVVNRWQRNGSVTTVLGFSGTPYLSKIDKLPIKDSATIRFPQITNTVYYYPLIAAINGFLKKPQVKIAKGMSNRLEVIRHGVADFRERFGDKRYGNGSIAKLAIYCSNIAALEKQVYPFLIGELGVPDGEVLRFHRGNKEHPQPAGTELEFLSLDHPAPHASGKRYILLVQVGKEGWDCRSLTGIILSQQGDCPRNTVLQTSCRCLRQVDQDPTETEEALIWLNEANAKTLNSQLKQQQHTTIEELNRARGSEGGEEVPRHSRMKQLALPALDFYQLKVKYRTAVETAPDTERDLRTLCDDLEHYRDVPSVIITDFDKMEQGDISIHEASGGEPASFRHWLHDISKGGFHFISVGHLLEHEESLQKIFEKITLPQYELVRWNEHYDRDAIAGRIRLAFHPRRKLRTSSEVIPETAQLLFVDRLRPIEDNPRLYPNREDSEGILRLDENPISLTEENREKIQQTIEQLKALNMPTTELERSLNQEHSTAVRQRDKTFHYLPYNFIQSGFELEFIEKVLALENFQRSPLEIYYNGERGLTGFVIDCFRQTQHGWRNVGRYTTDFLIIQRDAERSAIRKALMVETKGEGYAHDPAFQDRRNFVENEFLRENNAQFGYEKFDFLYLEDSATMDRNLVKLKDRMQTFFMD